MRIVRHLCIAIVLVCAAALPVSAGEMDTGIAATSTSAAAPTTGTSTLNELHIIILKMFQSLMATTL